MVFASSFFKQHACLTANTVTFCMITHSVGAILVPSECSLSLQGQYCVPGNEWSPYKHRETEYCLSWSPTTEVGNHQDGRPSRLFMHFGSEKLFKIMFDFQPSVFLQTPSHSAITDKKYIYEVVALFNRVKQKK